MRRILIERGREPECVENGIAQHIAEVVMQYSTLALQFGANLYSTPPPMVYPESVECRVCEENEPVTVLKLDASSSKA